VWPIRRPLPGLAPAGHVAAINQERIATEGTPADIKADNVAIYKTNASSHLHLGNL